MQKNLRLAFRRMNDVHHHADHSFPSHHEIRLDYCDHLHHSTVHENHHVLLGNRHDHPENPPFLDHVKNHVRPDHLFDHHDHDHLFSLLLRK